jgi:hypothetical protein
MRKIIFAFVMGLVPLLATTSETNAQISGRTAFFNSPVDIVEIDKLMSTPGNQANSDINSRALNNFEKSYKGVNTVRWLKTKNLITADFISDGIQTVVYYDKKGHWECTLKSYKEEKFDRSIRGIVKSKYYDYKIDLIQEIETRDTDGNPTYLAFIEDDNNFKVVRIEDEVMDVYEEFKRQK